jgi:hypothetical protein
VGVFGVGLDVFLSLFWSVNTRKKMKVQANPPSLLIFGSTATQFSLSISRFAAMQFSLLISRSVTTQFMVDF